MPYHLIFDFLLVTSCGYAIWCGGAPERTGAAIFLIAVVFTQVAVSGAASRFRSVEEGVLIVDLAMAVSLLILALRAERLWPLWVTALQVIGTAGHAVKLANPDVIPRAYAFVLAFWSYPMLLLLVLGTFRHQRRMARFGADRSWSSFSGRWDRRRRTGPIG
jgi:hypothetical protein